MKSLSKKLEVANASSTKFDTSCPPIIFFHVSSHSVVMNLSLKIFLYKKYIDVTLP